MKDLYYIMMFNHLGNAKYCKKLIKNKHVMVNGKTCLDSHYQVQFDDDITVDYQKIKAQPFTYIMLNKPKGYICARYDQKYPCVNDLIDQKDCYCLGRLDKDTTGLLIMSDDPTLSKRLLLPQNHVSKKYFVTTQYPMNHQYIEAFKKGIIIDQNTLCLPSQLEIIDDYHGYVTLQEGKYHQIKKMFLSCQNEVVDLKRISFGQIQLDQQLKIGTYRYLTENEIKLLIKNRE
ncbi:MULTISPECIES: 16S rRNA pseudouridine(516) synthase [Coprobacillaceae]|uniref:16S rRNA pseudouridine(516) synthase n=1 Tax=Coprobacillaceae TaxID=2810280 RepID=UPI001F3058D9|nr:MULTISPECIES: 16S rRNA pseudouridine(516) synthase [Coprobacillaceae]